MGRPPLKRSIAAALGVSPPALSRYISRGCPVHSIEAARRWQKSNVDPSQRSVNRNQPARARAGGREALAERAFNAGRTIGKRSALDWMIASQAVAAAAMVKHADMTPEDAVFAAGLALQCLHSVGRFQLGVQDADVNAVFDGYGESVCDFAAYCRSLDEKEPPALTIERATKLAKNLWPAPKAKVKKS